jgi:hypothetical protein
MTVALTVHNVTYHYFSGRRQWKRTIIRIARLASINYFHRNVINVMELLSQVWSSDLNLMNCNNFYVKGTSSIDVKGNKLHPNCFSCSQCNVSIVNQPYYEHYGNPYCQNCDTQLFCPKCGLCGQIIQRGMISLVI